MYQEGVAGWPRVKVLDFGVARFDDRASSDEIAGTPYYMSPEQWRGRAEARSDVYALGCVLYELITGVSPFEGSVSRVMAAHCDELPLPLSTQRSIPEALDRLVMRMLAKDPGHAPAHERRRARAHRRGLRLPARRPGWLASRRMLLGS